MTQSSYYPGNMYQSQYNPNLNQSYSQNQNLYQSQSNYQSQQRLTQSQYQYRPNQYNPNNPYNQKYNPDSTTAYNSSQSQNKPEQQQNSNKSEPTQQQTNKEKFSSIDMTSSEILPQNKIKYDEQSANIDAEEDDDNLFDPKNFLPKVDDSKTTNLNSEKVDDSKTKSENPNTIQVLSKPTADQENIDLIDFDHKITDTEVAQSQTQQNFDEFGSDTEIISDVRVSNTNSELVVSQIDEKSALGSEEKNIVDFN